MSRAAPLVALAEQVLGPTVFLGDFNKPETPPTFQALADRVAALAQGRALTFCPAQAWFPGYDERRGVDAISVRAHPPGAAEPIHHTGADLCWIADRWADDEDRLAALRVLRATWAASGRERSDDRGPGKHQVAA